MALIKQQLEDPSNPASFRISGAFGDGNLGP